jgi:hypothetical protein
MLTDQHTVEPEYEKDPIGVPTQGDSMAKYLPAHSVFAYHWQR